MQYEVPQFIEVEDRIFGPLTFKQFLYLAGAAGACVLFWALLPLWLAIPFCIPFVALGVALAFYKVNGRPLVDALEHAFGYYAGGKLYLWKQDQALGKHQEKVAAAIPQMPVLPKISESKLKDLAWSLNIKERRNLGVETNAPSGFEL